MTDTVTVSLITAFTSILGMLIGLWNSRSISKGRDAVAVVHDAVNGGLQDAKDELKAARAELATAVAEIKSLKEAANVTSMPRWTKGPQP